jgi:hypothetical protein
MYNLDQIQTTKITTKTIHSLNSYINLKSKELNSIGKAYEVLDFYQKENTSRDKWNYKINQYGYRDSEWDFNKTIAFFGCSFTFGIGVEHAYPFIIQQQLGKVIPNLGVPAGSAVNILKVFSAFSRLHPMTAAVISLPHISRFYQPTLEKSGWRSENLLPGFHDSKADRLFFKSWINNGDISYAVDYIDWAEDIAKQKEIEIFWTSWDINTRNFLKEAKLKNVFDWPQLVCDARDNSHPGQSTHYQMANRCLSLFKTNHNLSNFLKTS